LHTSTESSHYPITDLVLSQGGKPCVHYQTDQNNDEDKIEIKENTSIEMLIPDDYFKTCPEITVGEHTITESNLFQRINSFESVSEYKILQENEEGDYLKIMEDLPNFEVSKLQDYKFKMYSQKYHHWAPDCITTINGKEKPIDVYMLADTLESSSHKVSNMSVAITALVKILIVFTLFEYLMLFMHNNEALS